ncbi:MAG TPA: LLM class flavin-dependent oxidoreductase [Ktedonobacterales bacterium]|nr:LLM class flavin-dependent oxidoreductase [Ktedonobacterales bacterium]
MTTSMKYGFIIPTGDIHTVAELAAEAESAGWDGAFYWDGINIQDYPGFDPWVTMAAMAMRTTRVRLGAIVSPLSRRRPWKVARETVSVDHLSRGRLVLPVGLGALDDGGFGKVGEPTDRKTRAELLDESLDILTGLWSGEPFSYSGKHYYLDEMTFLPKPIQAPRIPIWVVGAWPSERSMARVLRYDGLLPNLIRDGKQQDITPSDIREMAAYVAERRALTTPFDIIMEGETPGDDPARAAEMVRPFAEAGATWWHESRWNAMGDVDIVRERIRQGPPRIEE